jgi:hypothetical protein
MGHAWRSRGSYQVPVRLHEYIATFFNAVPRQRHRIVALLLEIN